MSLSTVGLRGRGPHRPAALAGDPDRLRLRGAVLSGPAGGLRRRDAVLRGRSPAAGHPPVTPRRCTTAAASTRPPTPSLARMLETCTLAVLGLMNRACAISGFERPSASSTSTSRSRSVRPNRASSSTLAPAAVAAGSGAADGPGYPLPAGPPGPAS